MNIPQSNNNPVNLRYAKQKEAIGKDEHGFAKFPDPSSGWRAAHAQIVLDTNRGLTLRQFIEKFAPSNENRTEDYLDFVAEALKVTDTTPLKSMSPLALAGVMAGMEGYYAK
jgi:hypothetical protein